MRPKTAFLTQRVVVDPKTGERRDALDQNWGVFISACGMLSMPVPNSSDLAEALWERIQPDLLVLTGGNDLSVVGGDAPERDQTETRLLDLALTTQTPVIGVCRGAQMLGCYFGGSLKRVDGHVGDHVVEGKDGRRRVNSFHRFALANDIAGLTITARSEDGAIESFVGRETKVLGLMWHPERVLPFDARDIALVSSFLTAPSCAD